VWVRPHERMPPRPHRAKYFELPNSHEYCSAAAADRLRPLDVDTTAVVVVVVVVVVEGSFCALVRGPANRLDLPRWNMFILRRWRWRCKWRTRLKKERKQRH
jgi:hypothetical protein